MYVLQMWKRNTLLVAACLTVTVTSKVADANILTTIPLELPNHTPLYQIQRYGLSGDGRTVLRQTTTPNAAYRWSPETGLTQIEFPAAVTPVAISDNGADVFAQPNSGGMFVSRNHGQSIEQLPVRGTYGSVISSNGDVIIRSPNFSERWRAGEGFFSFPTLPPLPNHYNPDGSFERYGPGRFNAQAMSDDGSFIAGVTAYGSERVLPTGEAVPGSGRLINSVWQDQVGVQQYMNDVYGFDLRVWDMSSDGRFGVARDGVAVK